MQISKLRIVLALAVGLLASAGLIACGGGNDTSTAADATTQNASATTGGAGGTAQVDVAANSDLGKILVDGDGKTLYLFEKDSSANQSACSGDCATAWPPLTTDGKPKAGNGVDASNLTTFKRDDGTTQVAYAGHPLYRYAEDESAGDTNGNGSDEFGALWYAVTASGDAVQSGGGSGSSGGGSGGYSY